MFHIVYNRPREPIEERAISIDEAVRIIQEKGTRNMVLTLQIAPLVEEGVRPIDLLERIWGFFGVNRSDLTVKSGLYLGRDGTPEHYLQIEESGGKKVVVKYWD